MGSPVPGRDIAVITRGVMPIENKAIEKETGNDAAIVLQARRAPVYGDFKEPVPSTGESRIAVTAAQGMGVV
jgi:hypothetical protein